MYALEGSVAIAGAGVQWLRDNLGLIASASEVEGLAGSAPDNGGVYFVPAFSGLFAPYWRPDARGVVVGLTRFADRRHLARAVLESTAYQTRDVLAAMEADSGVALDTLFVDGGMTANGLLMQFQADLLGVPVVRPAVAETTVLGRGLRRRPGGGLLRRPRRTGGAVGRGAPLGAGDGPGRARPPLRRVAEGGGAHPGLGLSGAGGGAGAGAPVRWRPPRATQEPAP